jgi:Zn-finger nucleic acid-binding protein
MHICPRCTKVLEEKTIGGVTSEGCPGCGGAWFDDGELNEVAKRDPSALIAIDETFKNTLTRPPYERTLRCPVCLDGLTTFEFEHFPGIAVDGCRKCRGIWVDDGELTQIAERIRKARG